MEREHTLFVGESQIKRITKICAKVDRTFIGMTYDLHSTILALTNATYTYVSIYTLVVYLILTLIRKNIVR